MSIALTLLYMLVFPGFLFLTTFAMTAEYVDRKLHARLQNRVGPPWFQPFADFIKLAGKQDLIPGTADHLIFRAAPLVALASVLTAFCYIPVWQNRAPFSFDGDLIFVVYLLTLPTFMHFVGGWYSRSLYSMLGASRTLMQLFAYEIPIGLSLLAPAMLAGTWSISKISIFYSRHLEYLPLNLIGLCIALVAFLGKLERVPFDIAEAETEIVAGYITEYSGRLLAILRLTVSVEMIVGASLIAAIFLPFGLGWGPVAGFALYLVKVFGVVIVLTVCRTLVARLRIDQMIAFFWKILAPLAFLQFIINMLVKWMIAGT